MTKKRKVIFATMSSLVLVAVAVGAIAVFGYTPTPKFALLNDHPDPSISGTIAYLSDGGNGNTCLSVVPAGGGEKHQVRCDGALSSATIDFTKDGDLVLGTRSYDSFAKTKYEVLDGKTFQQRATFDVNTQGIISVPHDSNLDLYTDNAYDFGFGSGPGASVGDGLFNGGDGAHTTWVATDEAGAHRLLSRKAPADYGFISAKYSPDKTWFIVQTSDGDVLIGDKHGSARMLVRHDGDDYFFLRYMGSGLAWFQPGQTAGTVSVEDLKNGGSQAGPGAETSRSYVQNYRL
jgi:hypothetical protein